ncbi:unnamed protein product [Paramecium sonneborni]|uniref:Uncharacterized protein n=1 Tax=Paramecium sonneborni TaxID=65129 RepID=A0A8S1PML3_9CILI|nr:unnamed protein product [Paramecium sonneborni]
MEQTLFISQQEIEQVTKQKTININLGVLGHIDSSMTSLVKILSKVIQIIQDCNRKNHQLHPNQIQIQKQKYVELAFMEIFYILTPEYLERRLKMEIQKWKDYYNQIREIQGKIDSAFIWKNVKVKVFIESGINQDMKNDDDVVKIYKKYLFHK